MARFLRRCGSVGDLEREPRGGGWVAMGRGRGRVGREGKLKYKNQGRVGASAVRSLRGVAVWCLV